jgi:hypothetical protein
MRPASRPRIRPASIAISNHTFFIITSPFLDFVAQLDLRGLTNERSTRWLQIFICNPYSTDLSPHMTRYGYISVTIHAKLLVNPTDSKRADYVFVVIFASYSMLFITVLQV